MPMARGLGASSLDARAAGGDAPHVTQPRLVHPGSAIGSAPGRLAKIRGRLAVDADGCLYAAPIDDGGGSVGLAWPEDYAARLNSDGRVEILDRLAQVLLRQGEAFETGGGFGSNDPATWDTVHEGDDHADACSASKGAITRI